MEIPKIVAAVILSLLSIVVHSEPLSERQDRANDLLKEFFSPEGPGVQYIAVNKNDVIYQHSSGMADIKNKINLSASHTMNFFSITKTLTAIAILQLVEKGEISLEDSASRYIKHPYGSEITIKQLLNHTAGVPSPIPLRWVHLRENHRDFDEQSELERVLSENPDLDTVAGEEYSYSNIGYWLLGPIIEKVTNIRYSEYMEKNIFQPLNLRPQDIGFNIADDSNHAKGYLAKYSAMNLFKGFITDDEIWDEYEGKWLHVEDVYVNGAAFGGAIGTARSLSIILQDLLADESIILGNKGKTLLYTIQKTIEGKTIDMTLGWHVGDLNGINYFYKEGGGAGFKSEMRIYPKKGLASVIVTNKTSFNSRKPLGIIDSVFIE